MDRFNIDQGTIDILQLPGSKDTLHGFYAYQNDLRTEPTTQGNTLPGFGDHRPGYRQILTVNETHVFSPRPADGFRAGYNRVNVTFINTFTNDPSTFGYHNYPAVTPKRRHPVYDHLDYRYRDRRSRASIGTSRYAWVVSYFCNLYGWPACDQVWWGGPALSEC